MNQQFKNKQILLTSRPVGLPTEQNFEFKEIPVANTQDGQVVVRTLYLSVDPYMRGRMSDAKSYIPPFQLNEVIAGGIVGEIVESKSDLYKVGDKVIGMLGWQLYNTVDAKTVTKIDESIAPVSAYLSVPQGWKRLIIEKPFGRDLLSAQELNENLSQAFLEEEIFRIDHF
ncbi:hypothetical protein [Paenibacillus crassostreae]|uniref:hypothetical protein n=1 Tax=Paenibacillus crassostreae TaxID=1763538 RepID=UPI0008DB8DF9|nr:hypothetical protein [Paenibacillus crassostreae]AOZ94503.1 hypothetical protein LPB68_00005 [Paenibacillus crassostreae]